MAIETFWLEAKPPTPGLDQLGIRSTSIRLYNHLVPGITNQTYRARYYSIHAFTIDFWAREFHTTEKEGFRRLFRRIECVVGLAEKIRARDKQEHSPAVVGTDCFDRWLRECPSPLSDNLKVPIEEIEKNYFQNSWGAFGQYYNGSEEALRLVSWEDGIPKLVDPLGRQLAEAVRRNAEMANLGTLLKEKTLKVGQLRKLGDSFAFDRPSNAERDLLREMFFDSRNIYGTAGLRRRSSLLLLLSGANQLGSPMADSAWAVLQSGLYGCLTKGIPFVCPPILKPHLELWRIYALHEFFAFAMEVLLVLSIEEVGRRELDESGPAKSIEEISRHLCELLPRKLSKKKFGELVKESEATVRRTADDSPRTDFAEVTLRREAREALKKGQFPEAFLSAILLLARVAAHLVGVRSAYQSYAPETTVDQKRIGLDTLGKVAEELASRNVGDAALQLTSLAANTHLRVATAKLAYTRDFTYKITFENGYLRKVRDTEPAFSNPRLGAATQLLADLALLNPTSDGFFITPDGVAVLRRYECLT